MIFIHLYRPVKADSDNHPGIPAFTGDTDMAIQGYNGTYASPYPLQSGYATVVPSTPAPQQAPSYPPNPRPADQLSLGSAAAIPAAFRVAQVRNNAALFNARAGGFFKPTFGSTLIATLNPVSLFKSSAFSALFSFPIAVLANLPELRNGNQTMRQFTTAVVADGLAYTATSTMGAVGGALLAALVPVPFLAGIVGMAGAIGIGALMGQAYDRTMRPKFHQDIGAQLSSAGWFS